MRCETIRAMLNDYLDKTLSAGEELEVESHLAVCDSCRGEFRQLKRADDILRKTVREMISEIEVPPSLSDRIEMLLAGERKKKRLSRKLFAFLKTPAAAAVLLLAVATAGVLGYYGLFNREVEKSRVALTEPQAVPESRAAGTAGNSALTETLQRARTEGKMPVPENGEAEQNINEDPTTRRRLAGTAQEPAENARDAVDIGENSPKGLGELSAAGMPVLKKGTLEEAAAEAGFVPASPAYLPQGAELVDVSWDSSTVYQNFRVGQVHFIISQSRVDTDKNFCYEKMARQGNPVEINGLKAFMQETEPEPGDSVSPGNTTICWQQGEWLFLVSGELPGEEIIKVASSLKY